MDHLTINQSLLFINEFDATIHTNVIERVYINKTNCIYIFKNYTYKI